MCGRFSLATDTEELARRFGFEGGGLPRQARFNIAPGQETLTVVGDGSRNSARFMRWGLIPSWAEDPSAGSRMINARAETIDARPAVPQRVRKAALPRAGRRLLRVDEGGQAQDAREGHPQVGRAVRILPACGRRGGRRRTLLWPPAP